MENPINGPSLVVKHRLLLLLWCSFILLLCLLSFYAFPVADDFSYANTAFHSQSLWESQIREYQHWNGRFFSNLLVLTNPIKNGLSHLGFYRLIPILLIIVLLLSLYFIFKRLLPEKKTEQHLLISFSFTALYFHLMPNIAEGLFWYTGAVTYLIPCIIIPLHVYSLLLPSSFKNQFFQTLSILIIAGSNEIGMIYMILLQVFVFWIDQKKRLSRTFPLIWAIIVGLFVYTAPGNTSRAALFPQHHDFVYSLIYSTAQCLRFGLQWFLHPHFWLFVLLLLEFKFPPTLKKSIEGISYWKWLLFLSTLLFWCFFPAYWNTGILGQHRTANFGLFSCLLCALPLIIHLQKWETLKKIMVYRKKIIPLLFISGLSYGNIRYSLTDLFSGKATLFSEENKIRCQKIAQMKVGDTLYLSAIAHRPRCLFVLDLQANPQHWINQCYLNYFHKEGSLLILIEPDKKQKNNF